MGTNVSVVAANVHFNTHCIQFPANTKTTIAFDSRDGIVLHNISIYTDQTASTTLFHGENVTNAKTTYHVPGLAPGVYFFRCDVHPTEMTGVVVVK